MKLSYSVFEQPSGKADCLADAYSYWLIISGSGSFFSDEAHYLLTAHDVLEIPPDIPFQIESETGMQIGCVRLTDFETNNRSFHKKDYTSNEVIRKVFFFAMDLQGIHHPSRQEILEITDHLMFQALLTSGLEEYEINPGIAAVIDAFNTHYTEPDYDIGPAIQASGYSQSHFRKIFHEATGKTPLGYIQTRRIARAKYLLEQSERLEIREIALKCGFTDVYYFSRIFKKLCGMSPTQYRQAHQEAAR